ncbi:proton myo-inositol cotransporter hmit-1.2-like [Aedes albopictus]|uniref:Major facilitator superfamily (MFS) profile domain-containing protein n=1 Tax=Aedes albopictus TaxID=7160 RepID=A0ABM1YBT1_AEDAL
MEAKIDKNPELCDSFSNYRELAKKGQDRKYNDFHELQANFKELQVKDKAKNKQMMSKGNRKKKKKKQKKFHFEGETFKDPDPYQLAVRKTQYEKQKGKFVFEGEKFADPDPFGLAIRKNSNSSYDDRDVRQEYMSQGHHAHPGLVHGSMEYYNKNAYIGKLDDDDDEEDSSFDEGKQGCCNRAALAQFLAVSVKNVLLLGYGMTLGFPTIVIPAIQGGEGRGPSMEEGFTLNKDEISWLSSINLICVPLGCVFSGMLSQPIGRRRAMQLVNIPMFIAWILFHLADDVHFLYCGLALSGFSGGLSEAPVLTYVAEITQPRYRGMLAATGSTCVILGVLIQFFMGSFLRWRTVALCSACLPVISFILLFFVPESPVWLAKKHKEKQARRALAWLRGWVPEEQIEQEYDDLVKHMEEISEREKDFTAAKKMKLYTSRPFLKPFGLISLCFFIGHFSGMTTLQTYAVQIFHTLKAPIDKYYATILLGVAELLGTLFCVGLVRYSGKRPLVFVSTIGCAICFFSVASYAYFLHMIPGPSVSNVVANVSAIKTDVRVIPLNHTEILSIIQDDKLAALVQNTTNEISYVKQNDSAGVVYNNLNFTPLYINGSYDDTVNKDIRYGEYVRTVFPRDVLVKIPNANENKYLWLPLTLLLGSAFLTHMGIRLIPWMLIGELFAPSIRSGASGIAGGTGYIFGFLANKLFLKMLATFSLPGTFWIYSAITVVGTIILHRSLPETEGKSLLEIEEYFATRRKDSIHLDLDLEAPPKPKPRNSVTSITAVPPPLPPRSHPLKDDLGRIRKTSHIAQTRKLSETSNPSRKVSTTSTKSRRSSSSNQSSQSYNLNDAIPPVETVMENYRKISASKLPVTPPAVAPSTQPPLPAMSPKSIVIPLPQPEEPTHHTVTHRYRKISDTKRKTSTVLDPVIEGVQTTSVKSRPSHYHRHSRREKPTTMEGFDVRTWESNIKFEKLLRKRRKSQDYDDDDDNDYDANKDDGQGSNTSASQHDLRQMRQHIQQRDAHLLAMGRLRNRQNSGSLNMLNTVGHDNRAFVGSDESVSETQM